MNTQVILRVFLTSAVFLIFVISIVCVPVSLADDPPAKKTACFVTYPGGGGWSGCDPCITPNCAGCSGLPCD